jgi:hypothetical protein
MPLSNRLKESLRAIPQFIGAKYGYTDLQDAYLGKGDGSGEILATTAAYPRSVWCYQNTTEGRTVFTAVLSAACGIPYQDNPAYEGSAITIGYAPNSRVLMVVDSVRLEGGSSTGGTTLVEQQITNTTYVLQNRLMPLYLSPLGGLTVYVNPSPYYQPSTGSWKYFPGGDYTVSVPGAGLHQITVVVLDTETGTLTSASNTAVTGTLKDDFGYYTLQSVTFSPEHLISGAVHAYNGQTAISETDIYRDVDGRVLWTAASAYRLAGAVSAIVTKTGDYTLTGTDHTVLVDASGGAVVITLPTVASTYSGGIGREYVVKKIDSSGYTVTVDGAGSELIDGALTQVISAQWTALKLQSNGSAWYIL